MSLFSNSILHFMCLILLAIRCVCVCSFINMNTVLSHEPILIWYPVYYILLYSLFYLLNACLSAVMQWVMIVPTVKHFCVFFFQCVCQVSQRCGGALLLLQRPQCVSHWAVTPPDTDSLQINNTPPPSVWISVLRHFWSKNASEGWS